jgi:hypothetical protein
MSLELGDLPSPNGKIIENHLGVPGLAELGKRKWKREVLYAVGQLNRAFIADYVVLAAVWSTGSIDCRRESCAVKMKTHSSVESVYGRGNAILAS